jgi:tRNA pseudouridine38-40 synthase
VNEDQHARFNATSRTYRYFIHLTKDPFKTTGSTRITHQLDFEEMNEAAKLLLGTHDFTSFSKLHTDVKTNICSVTKAAWVRTDDTIYFEITANRFLRNMVRAIVGTLLDVGGSKTSLSEFHDIFLAMDRQSASISAPAHGLYLWRVEY